MAVPPTALFTPEFAATILLITFSNGQFENESVPATPHSRFPDTAY
jgi:hypothetical protein